MPFFTAFSSLCFGHNAAELLVVDELGDGGVEAADRALGILAQLEFAEAHVERVDQQQPADERIALAENQLDDLGGLDDADQPRKNAQHAALGATGNQARRRRLRDRGSGSRGRRFGGEDAGLALESEDGAVDVGLAQQDAGVVDQIAGGEVVRAVGDDVVVLENVEGVGARPAWFRA